MHVDQVQACQLMSVHDLADTVMRKEQVVEPCVTVPPPGVTAAAAQVASVKTDDTVITSSTAVKPIGLTDDRVEPITGIRKAMVKAMSRAQQVPHFRYDDEVRLGISTSVT